MVFLPAHQICSVAPLYTLLGYFCLSSFSLFTWLTSTESTENLLKITLGKTLFQLWTDFMSTPCAVCMQVNEIFPLFLPRGLAQIEFDLGPRTVRVSMASKRFSIYWRGRESLWDWTCIQNVKMICNQKHLHSTYILH